MHPVIVVTGLASLVWWWAADRRLRRIGARRFWRLLLAAFVLGLTAYAVLLGVMSFWWAVPRFVPIPWAVASYLWHTAVLPGFLGLYLVIITLGWARRGLRARRRARPGDESVSTPEAPEASEDEPTSPRPSRRQVLGAAAVALPPLATLGVAAWGSAEQGRFGVRIVDLRLPTLPPDLDGLTIAHVSDLHLGKFTPKSTARRVADAVNAMGADFVAFTGDLIDVGDWSQFAPGVEFLRSLTPRHGLLMIEGNHDVMNDAHTFEDAARGAGLPLMLDEATTFRVPGKATAVQFLGLTWGAWVWGRDVGRTGVDADRQFREFSDDAAAASVQRVLTLRDPAAFPIVLAHHPHAFDASAAVGLPLTLSGHTHGGQIMLTDHLGGGPIRFRYWTGLYRKAKSQLYISNGIGNWYPLRVNAPAEITHLTLRSGG
jgi:predicted MPP superfamily phosphohydrolase